MIGVRHCRAAAAGLAALAAAACVPQAGLPVASGQGAAPAGSASREWTYPVGSMSDYTSTRNLIGSHTAMDRIFQSRPIAAASAPLPLRPGPDPTPEIRFSHGGRDWTLDSYLAATSTTAFLALRRDGTIVVERYLHQRRPEDRFASWSMAKTVVAMLVGLAVQDGRIRSLDDPVSAYVPGLADSAHGPVPIRHVLTMSSGVGFEEAYGRPGSDISRLALGSLHGHARGGVATVDWISRRAAQPGALFNYASADTQVLGLVLSAATGQSLAALTEERIWRPMGAEFPANWLIDRAGQEVAFCCMNAALRDYGRLGLLMANDGRALDGRQVLPAAWVQAMMTPSAGAGAPGGGYGYQMWLSTGVEYASFFGVRGQQISVHRASGMVFVRTAANDQESNPADRLFLGSLVRAMVAQFATGP
ncbi:serine hydrolase domain-containing protein [Falsiroseomonas oryzae]|uniref:serine hydrolase domain-containing protein n=1 Tax=Falsiroseomonas oryzae TaxID=2766473 RepID=UPI0022EA9F99|nr:serine hydrolase [Roseomonas sp. MO-31]